MPSNVVPSCVLSKGGYFMPRPMSFDRACSPWEVMACYATRRSTVCAAQGRLWHATPDVVRTCMVSKGDDGMPYPISFDRLCCP